MKSKNEIINILSLLENINRSIIKQYIKSFEKLMKSETRLYSDNFGLEDYKMNLFDYNILYNIYLYTKKSPLKIQLILYFMYSYYKFDCIDYYYDFPCKLFFDFIKDNENIHELILKLVTIN